MIAHGERAYGHALLPVTDPAELDLAKALSARLDEIEPLIARWNQVAAIRPKSGSEIALDDRYSAWRQLSHAVAASLNMSVDNLRAVESLTRSDGSMTVPQLAHYSLIRSALESGSLGLWIVGPNDPRVRLDRLIRAARAELDDELTTTRVAIEHLAADQDGPVSRALLDRARKQELAKRSKHVSQIRDVASRLGLQDPTSRKWSVGFAEITREAMEHTGLKGYYGEVIWRMISGLTHPSSMRQVARSNLQELAENPDGTINTLVTSDLELTRIALETAVVVTASAVEILGARKLRPADPTHYAATP